ncbi:30S ribosomal subunit protein S8 [Candidatus Nasuia deltocephalinicola]|uniref:Small ribosomal subunit protein uS8 n=1 Tax=Candidatus Nasuia deltocephalincola TaxID=1160784 RepID=A0A975A406_9PROT|nr:30S ribosomal protein S8 [Candidatus Nasuia deltocephalinicola]BEH03937.1 30S ribosomal subunit protein S8 [Candidatus Nasuia deltocephalinicola]
MFGVFNTFPDFINRIIVSQKLNLNYAIVIYSKFFISILKILKFEGYIDNIFLFNYLNFKFIIIKLKYYNNFPVIRFFKKISKSGFKIYKKYKFIQNYMNGLGIIIVSTNLGLITNKLCKIIGIGGELICYVF